MPGAMSLFQEQEQETNTASPTHRSTQLSTLDSALSLEDLRLLDSLKALLDSPEALRLLELLPELAAVHKQLLGYAAAQHARPARAACLVGGNGVEGHLAHSHLGACMCKSIGNRQCGLGGVIGIGEHLAHGHLGAWIGAEKRQGIARPMAALAVR